MSQYAKLKTNLKLAIQRLKLLEKKKTELSLKSRKEIADYMAINKADRARIRVEHIIREDNYVEAMEMLEMFCDMLLARFGLIEKMKELDPGLDESIATIIWASPRVSSDILEFKIIAEILSHKYGKKYAEACKADSINNVNEKVKRRLGLEAPPKLLVEQYLIEIAKNFNVDYTPDNAVMLASGHMNEELISLRDTVKDITNRNNNNNNNHGGSGGTSAGMEAAYYPTHHQDPASESKNCIPIGFNENPNQNLIDLNDSEDNASNYNNRIRQNVLPPALPDSFPVGDVPRPARSSRNSPPPNYQNNARFHEDDSSNAPRLPSKKQDFDYPPQDPNIPTEEYHQSPPPSYMTRSENFNQNAYSPVVHPPSLPPVGYDEDDLVLPSVPGASGGADLNASIEFDDLAKRFENLKSNKK